MHFYLLIRAVDWSSRLDLAKSVEFTAVRVGNRPDVLDSMFRSSEKAFLGSHDSACLTKSTSSLMLSKVQTLVQDAEDCLVLSNFASAETLSREAIEILQTLREDLSELKDRACSICMQALFEQGR